VRSLVLLLCVLGAPALAQREAPLRHMTQQQCLAHLARHDVEVSPADAEAVHQPVRVREIGGVEVVYEGRRAVNHVMDCRLVAALTEWVPRLRAAGVVRVRHLSAFRPGSRVRGSSRPSGHSRGLAVDLRYFELEDGRTLDVLEDWEQRERGADPCAVDDDNPIRDAVCAAVARDLFQVVVTPHHDDAHANHVHLEVVPRVPWQWVR